MREANNANNAGGKSAQDTRGGDQFVYRTVFMSLSHADIQEILKLLDATSFDEMHLEVDGLKISLSRSGASAPASFDEEKADTSGTTKQANPKLPVKQTQPSSAGSNNALLDINAPMLGVFYSAPKPGAEPFVKVGRVVEQETVVCIIEVMKLMNSVQSGVAGEIVEIHAEDGELVEYGQLLFRVKG